MLLLEPKKSTRANLETKKPLFFGIGLLISLAITLAAFEWKSSNRLTEVKYLPDDAVFAEEVIAEIRSEAPLPPPPVPEQTTILKVVENDVKVKDDLQIEAEPTQEETIKPVNPLEGIADDQQIYAAVESMPVFPGGSAALYKFIRENLRYPKAALDKGIQGRVIITFIVETDGSISSIKVIKGIGSGCEEEAVRMIASMPRWIPGKQHGAPVRVQFNLPLRFSLGMPK